MIKSLLLALPFVVGFAAADTTVTVLEIGSKTVVRSSSTSSNGRNASPNAVKSFWASLHDSSDDKNSRRSRSLSAQGLSVVGDLFNKPDAGVVVGVSATKAQMAASMPELSKALLAENSVGDMTMRGSQSASLLTAAKGARFLTSAQDIDANVSSAAEADAQFSRMLSELKQQAATNGQTIVLHVVMDDDAESSDLATRRQLEARDLENEDEDNNNEEEDANNNEEEAANDDGYYQKSYSEGFYGYGYYNDSGEYVTVSKTIFQIQYHQTVLWTAISMVAITYVAFYMTANMPLMADTLLFGESAKMVGA
jgi:hypothetical protein